MKLLVLSSVCIVFLMLNIDLTIANLALPQIAHDFNVQLISVKWVLTAYLISSGAFMVLGGRLGDIYSLKKIFIIGLIIFTVFSFFCGISPNNTVLICCRFIQGIGMAFCLPLGFAIVSNAFEGHQKAMAIAVLNGVTGVTLAIGPMLGGIILHFLNWRWFFFINVPIGVLATILGICLIKSVPGKSEENIDKWGAMAVIGGILILMFGLNEVGRGTNDWIAWVIFAVGVILLLSYRWVEKKQKNPLVDPQVIRSSTFLKVIFVQSINQYIFFSVIILLSLYYQNILGFTSLIAGLILGVLTITFAIGSPLVGWLLKFVPQKVLVITGSSLLLVSSILFGIKIANPSLISLVAPLIVLGLGVALIQAPNMTIVMSIFSTEKSGVVSSLFLSVLLLGGTIGTTVTSLNLSTVSSHQLNLDLKEKKISVTHAKELLLEKTAEGSAALKKLPFPSNIKIMVKNSFLKAYDRVLQVFFFLSLAAIIMSFFYRKKIDKQGANPE